jgi:hypothetical protein
MDREKAKLEGLGHFFELHGKPIQRCHEPNEECQQTAIRAHSIPSSKVLETLARDGHVVMPKLKLKHPPPSTIDFELVGKNKATTFSGLCSKHDNDLFRRIDTAAPDLGSAEHLFLLAYRAVIREFHVVLENAIRFQASYKKRVDLELSPGNVPCDFGMFATEALCNAFESHEYKRSFDVIWLAGEWDRLEHRILEFANQRPSIAVSSMFSLDDVDAPETPRLALSVFPAGSGVAAVFSFTHDDAPYVLGYLRRLLASEPNFQKYQLSKLVLQSCDNFVVDPRYWESLPTDNREAITQFYVDTLNDNLDDHEDQRLYLF